MKNFEKIPELIKTSCIYIWSGEGEVGHIEPYKGKRTMRAIRIRLSKERCGGERWARAMIYFGTSEYGQPIHIDFETGDLA